MSKPFPLPDNTQRVAVIGSTGSGKTLAAAWHLSLRDFDAMPWVVVDFKHDDFLAKIGAKEIPVSKPIPTKPGLYIMRPKPFEVAVLEKRLWEMWEHERVGLYIDEGYMIPNDSPAFQAILTQGRSKKVPCITLSQRPVWMSRFVFSEADFYQVFRLNDARDRQTVQAFVPRALDLSGSLPPFHSWYYAVGTNQIFVLRPVPDRNSLLATFHARLKYRPERYSRRVI